MGKAREVAGFQRIHANTSRYYTGLVAKGVAGALKGQLWAFATMLAADNCNGLSDAEVRHLKKARVEMRNAMRRLDVVGERCMDE